MSRRPADQPPDTAHALVEAINVVTRSDGPNAALQAMVDQACELVGARNAALLSVDGKGRPSRMFRCGGNDDDPALSELDGIAITSRGHTFGLLYLPDHVDGVPIAPERFDAVRALGRVAGQVLDLGRTESASERRRIWQNHSAALASTLQPPFNFARADQAVTDSAMRAAGAVAATTARLVDGEILLTSSSGSPPVWVAGEEHEAAVHAVLDGSVGEAEAGGHHIAVLASMSTHLNPAAVLAVYFPISRPPDDSEMDLLAEFAEQAAMALDRAQAFRDREQMALVTDRDRIARELHDVVIQRLFATGLHLQKSRTMVTDPDVEERLALSMQDLDQTIRAIRGSIFDLQGGPRSSVRSDLRDIVAEFVDPLGFTPTVHTHGQVDSSLTGGKQQAFGDVLRQGLSNIVQHARASSASIELVADADSLTLVVRDDGQGLADGHREAGLRELREEVAMRGGTLTVSGSPDEGTTLRCVIPLA